MEIYPVVLINAANSAITQHFFSKLNLDISSLHLEEKVISYYIPFTIY